ncbi:hypothetical protein NSA23_06645 [Anaerosalibacter massiliensis]|uniref:Uncharacterized protein n=2 Tax=Anaerosalibacter massiliensis TaxID=1347392 RepID=A0A9X2MIH7_9FIRM|nr:hypothetical protein [Anaerosalibacter massiliensis]MCR2043797.1 hypothetical protein [Anaerosalibacter massiliensis]
MKKFFISSILLLTIILGGGITCYADSVESNVVNLSEEDKLEIREMLDELNIDKTTQDNLINKLENNQIWDCMDEEQVSKIPENYFNVSIDEPVKRYTFPDGSVIETKLELPMISPSAVTGGSVSSGSGYTSVRGAKVSTKKGLVGMGFYADYTNVNGAYDYISRVYDSWVKVVGGSYSNRKLKIVKKREDISGPAEAKLSADVSWVGGVTGAGTEWLKLRVGKDKAWSSQN